MSEAVDRRLETEKYIGLGLALASGVLIGISFIITKKGLIDAGKKPGKVAGEGYEHLRNPMWWAGTGTSTFVVNVVILGEIANFLAYSFAPAILVTPLGAVSVLVGYLQCNLVLYYLLYFSMKSWERMV
jgi:hypothetical protein